MSNEITTKTTNIFKTLKKNFYKILCVIFAIFIVATYVPKIYFRIFPKSYQSTARVIDIIPNDSENSTICFQLANNRHIYCIETSEKYELDELYNLTFSSKNTITILDDEIIKIERPI